MDNVYIGHLLCVVDVWPVFADGVVNDVVISKCVSESFFSFWCITARESKDYDLILILGLSMSMCADISSVFWNLLMTQWHMMKYSTLFNLILKLFFIYRCSVNRMMNLWPSLLLLSKMNILIPNHVTDLLPLIFLEPFPNFFETCHHKSQNIFSGNGKMFHSFFFPIRNEILV